MAWVGLNVTLKRPGQSIEHKAGMCCPPDPPAHDIASLDADHEGDRDEPGPCREAGEVRTPKHVRRRCMELAVDLVERARRSLVAHRRLGRLDPDHALQADIAKQACEVRTNR